MSRAINIILRNAPPIIRPPPTRHAAEWADFERVLPPGSPEPGRWRSQRTPYMTPFLEAASNPLYSSIVFACGAQMGKTENLLNIVGHRLTDGPFVPVLLVFPTEKLSMSMSRDRFGKMIRSTKVLEKRLAKGQADKVKEKFFNGIRCGFAHAGSATELSSHPAGLVVIDEIDRMSDVRGEGDPYLLAKARTKNYAAAKVIITSTPTVKGMSRIWSLWESGTMGRWSWPCIHCNRYFVPVLDLLKWDKSGDATQAKNTAFVVCPECGGHLLTKHRNKMNAAGRYEFCIKLESGDYKNMGTTPPENPTASFWASGLASPWQTFEDIAYLLETAERSRDIGTMQSAVNTYGGEVFQLRGDAPEWQRVQSQIIDYSQEKLPRDAQFLTMGVDVQERLLYYVIRAYGYRGESWLVKHGEIHGATEFDQVWKELAEVVEQQYGGLHLARVFVDSGYYPGRKHFVRPDNQIYAFCRLLRGLCYPSKGRDMQAKPVISSAIDITLSGKTYKNGLVLWHIDTDYFKRQLYNAIRRDPQENYGWHVHRQITEEYCRQVVSEECITEEGGKRTWHKIREDNHFLDCEVLADAAAYSVGVHNLKKPEPINHEVKPAEKKSKSFVPQQEGSFINRR